MNWQYIDWILTVKHSQAYKKTNFCILLASTDRIELYEGERFRGLRVNITCDAPYLGRFNDRASSAKVYGKTCQNQDIYCN